MGILNWFKGEDAVKGNDDDRPIRFVEVTENVWNVEYADEIV
jgi:hypothetical protein